ncbi:MAG: DUF2252 family protein [Massilia sp.]|nr:DUF2252 family protein [Massilia sp.]
MNIIKRIQKANEGRDPERLGLKFRALRADPFTFLRGTCHLFYDRLREAGFDVAAPPVWCSGDLHLENFGSYKGDNRLVYFDINDFDEAALAPASWELVRLAASLHVAVAAQTLPAERGAALADVLIDAYAQALACGKPAWIERDTAHGAVRELLDQLRARRRVDWLNGRTRLVRKRRRLVVDGRRTLAVTDAERAEVSATMQAFAAGQPEPDFFRVLDVARRIAGTGSLGVARWVVLVEGRGSPDHNYLFDLKRAGPSSLGRVFRDLQPRWPDDAHRVAGVQRRMQAVTAAFLHPVTHGGAPFVLRALQPSEDRLPFARFSDQSELLEGAVAMLARCVAWAQLRSGGRQGAACADDLIAFAGRKKWRRQIAQAAAAAARQAMADWTTFAAAYDAGLCQPAPPME